MIKYKSSINQHQNPDPRLIAPTPILLQGSAYLQPTANTIPDAMQKKQSAVSAPNKQLQPRWLRTVADKSNKSMLLLSCLEINSLHLADIVGSILRSSHTMMYPYINKRTNLKYTWEALPKVTKRPTPLLIFSPFRSGPKVQASLYLDINIKSYPIDML